MAEQLLELSNTIVIGLLALHMLFGTSFVPSKCNFLIALSRRLPTGNLSNSNLKTISVV